MATNIGKASAALAIGGVEYEQALGMMTAITEIQRSGAKAARGLVSIQSRYNQILDDTSSTGQKLIAFYDEHSIQLYDQEGQLRSLWETLSDVAKIWDTLDENEQKYFLNIQAGANQSVQLGALMGNFQTAIEATETALNSAGSAMRENESYMQSLNARTDLLKATFQTLANDVIPKELIAKGLEALDKVLKLLDTDLGVFITRVSLLTGIGWGLSSLIGASKILPTVVSQIGNFVKLITGATIVIPEAAAATGGLTAAFATFQSVALPVIGILSLLGVGIYAIVKASKEKKKAIEELTQSIKAYDEALENSNKTLKDNTTETQKTVAIADQYVARLETLQKKTQLTKEEQEEYHAILSNLTTLIPELSGIIDLQTDSINGGTDAIRRQIDAWKDLAIQQAYQQKMSDVYSAIAEISIEKQQRQSELEALQAERGSLVSQQTGLQLQYQQGLNNLEYATSPGFAQKMHEIEVSAYEGQRRITEIDKSLPNYTQALDELNTKLAEAEKDALSMQEAVTSLMKDFSSESDDSGSVVPWDGPSWQQIQEQQEKLDEYYRTHFPEIYYHNLNNANGSTENSISSEMEKATDSTEEFKDDLFDIEEEIVTIIDAVNSYLNDSKTYTNLLETQYNLLVLQGASEEEIVSKVKEIQNFDHEIAENLRVVLRNADRLNLTTDDIYEIQTLINERSINWWNWQNKIKDNSEEIADNYDEIEDSIDEIKEAQIAELNTEKNAISALSSAMVEYYDKQKEEIDNQIQALKDSNAEIEEQITLQEKLDALAKAKQNKIYVYKDGRFQYLDDADAISSATKDLESYQRQKQLQAEIAGLEDEKQALENMQSAWSNMVQDYEKEQDRWLINQQLGIDTALSGWEKLVSGAETYAQRYKEIMSELADLESQEESKGSSSGSNSGSNASLKSHTSDKTYDPNLDYSALMLQATSLDEVNHWASKREEKIKGEGLSPTKSTSEFFDEWKQTHSYANGTLSALGGISLVGEHGAELRLLNRGDGIIPSDITTNLMSWGSMTPNQFKMSSFNGIRNGMNVTIQALNLPNVSDGASFVDYVRNNMFGQVLSFVH